MRLFNRKGKSSQSQESPKASQRATPPQPPPQPPPPLMQNEVPPRSTSYHRPLETFKPLPSLEVSLDLPDLPTASLVFGQPSQQAPVAQLEQFPEQSLTDLAGAQATVTAQHQAPSRKNTLQSDFDYLFTMDESLDPIDPKVMLEQELREQFGRSRSNTTRSIPPDSATQLTRRQSSHYQLVSAALDQPSAIGQFLDLAPIPEIPPAQVQAQPRPLVHPLVQQQAQPMVQSMTRIQPMPTTQAQTHPQTAVASPRTLTQVQMSTAAAMEHRAMTMSGNNAMEATDAIDRQYTVSRSSHGSSSPTSSDEEVGVVKLAKQAATMTLTSGKPEASADPNRKLSDRAANIQKMREVSALGKNMSFGPMHARSGSLGGLSRKSDNDDDNDSVPLGGLKRTGGSTTTTAGQQPGGGAVAMIPQQAYGVPVPTQNIEVGHIKAMRQQQMQQFALQFNPQSLASPQSLTSQMQPHSTMQHQAMLNMPINHQPHMAAQMNMYQAQQAAMSGVGLFPVHQQIPAPSPRMQQILKTSPVSQKSHRQPGAEQLPRSDSRQQQQVVGSGLEQQPVSANPGLEQAPEVKPTEESESRSLASVSVQDQQQASLSGSQTPRQLPQQLPPHVLAQQQQQMMMAAAAAAAAAGNAMVGGGSGGRVYPGTPTMTPGRQAPNPLFTPQMQAASIQPMYNARTPMGPHMVLMNSNGQRVNGSSSTSALYNNVGLAQMASMMEHPGKLSHQQQQLQQQHMQQFYAQNGMPMGMQAGGSQFVQSPVIQGDPRAMQLNGMMGQVGVGPSGTPVFAAKSLNITPATNQQSLMNFIPNLPMSAKGSMAKNPLMRDLSKMKQFSTSDYATRPTLLAEADSRKVAKKTIPGLGGSSSHSFQPDLVQAQKQLMYLQQQLQIQQQQLHGQMDPPTPPSQAQQAQQVQQAQQTQQTPRQQPQQHQRETSRNCRYDTPSQGMSSSHTTQKNHGRHSVSSSTSYIDSERYHSKGGDHRGHTRRDHHGSNHRHTAYSSEYDDEDRHGHREFRQRAPPPQSKSRKFLGRARRRNQHDDDYYDYDDYDEEDAYRSDYYDEYDGREYDDRYYDGRDDDPRGRRGGGHRKYQDRPPTARRGRERESRGGNRHRVPSLERAGGRDEVPGPVKRIIGGLEDPRDKKGLARGERRHHRQEYSSDSDGLETKRKSKAKPKEKSRNKEKSKEKSKEKAAAARTSIDSPKARSPLRRAMAGIKKHGSIAGSPISTTSLSPASICKSILSSASSTRKNAGRHRVDNDEQESDESDSESDNAQRSKTPSAKSGTRSKSSKGPSSPKKPRPVSMVTEWTENVRKPLPTPTPPGRKVSCTSKSAVVAL